jgi:arylsulfatase A-like enzyme
MSDTSPVGTAAPVRPPVGSTTARLLRQGLAIAGAVAALGLGCQQASHGSEAGASRVTQPEVRLVVLIAVDQLMAERIDAGLPGAIGRLAREGRSFSEAVIDDARTETCPGHVTMLTGRHPGPAGIPGNEFIDRATLRTVYCAEDASEAGRLLGAPTPKPESGRSPRNLRVTALGDWLKAQRPEARVFSVSAKDRSAIMMGGQRPDGVYWLDKRGTGRMTSSRYYQDALPGWVQAWTLNKMLAPLPEQWVHASGDPPNGTRPDRYPGESPRFSDVSPHPVKPTGGGSNDFSPLLSTPYLDQRTLDFARELVVEEQLGRDETADLLAVSLSATDYVGHSYGPYSQEARDALQRLDRDLGDFMDFLERRVGADRVAFVLTADHGVLPLPEWLTERGGTCPVAGGRVSPGEIERALLGALTGKLGQSRSRWLVRSGYSLVFDPATLAASGATLEQAQAVAISALEAHPAVDRVWRRRDLIEGVADAPPELRLHANSRADGRDADLIIQPEHGCLLSPYPVGTSHGSPHDYDRRVPLIFLGPGVEAGIDSGRAATIDIAPTLAAMLGLETPADLDGRRLELTGRP